MIREFLTAIAAMASPGQPAAETSPGAVDYELGQNWLCLPGREDVCAKPLPTATLDPGGYGRPALSPVAGTPSIDCFYVYPTVSRDKGLNSDLDLGAEERRAVEVQFARFSGACRTFAPAYRQMTIASIAAMSAGVDVSKAALVAYADVANAWKTYLAKHNNGRPFVLIGHSQGSAMMQQLIRQEIEGKPIAGRMLRAVIPGYNVLVPQGRVVGGTFKSTPLCTSPRQTGCVLTWATFRENNPPPEGAMFGWAKAPGMTIACTNPAKPGSKDWERLDSVWYARSSAPVAGGPVQWSTQGPPPTPYLRTRGLVSGKCINDGQRGYLSLRTHADPKDRRTDRIGGEVGIGGLFVPGWGMHLADMDAALGNLVAQVRELERTSE
ncbi:MAG TPA: DUF3089 domain-containing protein [Sphingomicrobium sp.]|nr:DUF3089 domain-containing protein [Sphingomicrobium sp.]